MEALPVWAGAKAVAPATRAERAARRNMLTIIDETKSKRAELGAPWATQDGSPVQLGPCDMRLGVCKHTCNIWTYSTEGEGLKFD